MKKLVILFTLILFIISCGEKVREEIIRRYDNGQMKVIVKYKGKGSDEVITERITYNENGDTLLLEKPRDKFKMVRDYFNNGQKMKEVTYKDGKKDGLYTWWYENGQKSQEGTIKDGKEISSKSWNEDGTEQ